MRSLFSMALLLALACCPTADARLRLPADGVETVAVTIDGVPDTGAALRIGGFARLGEPPRDSIRFQEVVFSGDDFSVVFPRQAWAVEECDGEVCLTPSVVWRGVADGLVLRPETAGPVFRIGIGRDDPNWQRRPPNDRYDLTLAQPLEYVGWGGARLRIESLDASLLYFVPEPSAAVLAAGLLAAGAGAGRRRPLASESPTSE